MANFVLKPFGQEVYLPHSLIISVERHSRIPETLEESSSDNFSRIYLACCRLCSFIFSFLFLMVSNPLFIVTVTGSFLVAMIESD